LRLIQLFTDPFGAIRVAATCIGTFGSAGVATRKRWILQTSGGAVGHGNALQQNEPKDERANAKAPHDEWIFLDLQYIIL
jgi:hypothetical protein